MKTSEERTLCQRKATVNHMDTAAPQRARANEKKIVSISSKRQITIPQKFFSILGFDTEAECIMRENELVIRPVRAASGGEFADLILADLIKEGYAGEALLAAFRQRQANIRPAVEAMLSEADDIAVGIGDYATYEDIFGDDEESV